jgi:4-carboxymuconolactone decarboxylase
VSDAAAPRIEPRSRESWDAAVDAALERAFPPATVERFRSTGDDALAVPEAIATMLHHPDLAGAWLAYNNVLLWNGTLDARTRELLVLRVAWRTQANYEWTQHVRLARRVGLTDDEIDRVAAGAHAWDEPDEALLRATDELLDTYRISDATWATLAERFDTTQLLELLFVVGTYTLLAMQFKSLGLRLEPGSEHTAVGLPDTTSP